MIESSDHLTLTTHTNRLCISESGRFDPDRENAEIMRVTCTDGWTQNHSGPCAAICRSQTDNDLDINTVMEVRRTSNYKFLIDVTQSFFIGNYSRRVECRRK